MAQPAFKDGDGGGEAFDPRDLTIAMLEEQVDDLRNVMRNLLDSDGAEATKWMIAAEVLLSALDQVDREIEGEQDSAEYDASPVCLNCGTWKGVNAAYCPECDADAIARLKEQAPEPTNVVSLNCPF